MATGKAFQYSAYERARALEARVVDSELLFDKILNEHTYHDLIWLFEAQLQSVFKCLDDHAHSLWCEREPARPLA